MYGLKYIAAFKDLDNSSYRVEISQDGYSGKVTELIAAGTPFTTSYKEEDFLYQPLRLSGGTLSVVGKDYLQDLYSEGPSRNKVNLYKENELIWTGFILPEIYTQNYSNDLFEFSIETVSALSILEYIKFEEKTGLITLFDLIVDATKKSNGDYKGFYIPAVYETTSRNALKDMSVLSMNFIDEEGDPMTYKEILEEICKFFSWTATDHEGYIYFLDIDYIRKGFSEYFFYDKNIQESRVNLSVEKQNVQLQIFTGTGATLDIIPGYNKVNVICSDYEAKTDSLYPELKNNSKDRTFSESKSSGDIHMYKNLYESPDIWDLKSYKPSGVRFVESKIEYRPSGNTSMPGQKSAGAVLCNRVNFDINSIPNKLNWEEVIQIKLFYDTNKNLLLDKEGFQYPVIKTAGKTRPFFFDHGYLMAIDFSVQFFDLDHGYVGTRAHNKKDQIGKGVGPTIEMIKDWNVPVSLRIGDKYYAGSDDDAGAGSWVKNEHIFKIYTDISKNTHFTFDWLNCKNDFSFMDGTETLKGRRIIIPPGTFGDVELTIYCPRSTPFTSREYNHRFVFMKNISIKAEKTKLYKSDIAEGKADTMYEQVVNDAFINQAEDIMLKLTSKNDADLSYSKVIYNNKALDQIYNRITDSYLKPEELIIHRIANQYLSSKIKTTQTLKPGIVPYRTVTDDFQKGKEFLMIGEDINYKMLQSEVTLIEIK